MFAACVDAAPTDLGTTSQALTPVEGQGWDIQGWDIQGWDIQGWDIQGWDIQGAIVGGQTVSSVNVIGTQIEIWKNTYIRAEQYLPDRKCTWSLDRTVFYGCTYPATGQPSPLAGAKLKGNFKRTDGTTFTGWIRIGTGTTDATAVTTDTAKVAMFPLNGHALSNACGGVVYPLGTRDPNPWDGVTIEVDGRCQNPNGCRKNCDVWLYDLDLLTPDGQTLDWCPDGHKATAVDGTYSSIGSYNSKAAGITLACTNGTIAKCTRWGYRPYGSARKHCDKGTCAPDTTLYGLRDYHQSCVRAAMADYCAEGIPFTKNGTLVDIWDYEPSAYDSYGFIPRTKGLLENKGEQRTVFLEESTFDKYGAFMIDHQRYQESNPQINATCGEKFQHYTGTDDVPPTWLRNTVNYAPPAVKVDSTTACSHSELTPGKWLHEGCASCNVPAYCMDAADSRGWNEDCVAASNASCAMTSHGECSPGERLNMFATGCTLRVCSTEGYESCCAADGEWTQACADAADDLCTGGQERWSKASTFCHKVILTTPRLPLPPTNHL